jgi:hypothetical protein
MAKNLTGVIPSRVALLVSLLPPLQNARRASRWRATAWLAAICCNKIRNAGGGRRGRRRGERQNWNFALLVGWPRDEMLRRSTR